MFNNIKNLEKSIGKNPYDSENDLVAFIENERRPINYTEIVAPNARVIAFGESHLDMHAKVEVENSLSHLKDLGFTHLGMEFFGTELQNILDHYATTKNDNDKLILIKHLKTYSDTGAALYLQIVDKAISLGIKVLGLDMPQKEKDRYEESQNIELQQARNPFMAEQIQNVLTTNENHKIVVFAGTGHIRNIDEGDGSIAVILKSNNIPITTVDLSGRLIKMGYPYSYQGPSISECAREAGLSEEKFILPAQIKSSDASIPYDWIMHLPQVSN